MDVDELKNLLFEMLEGNGELFSDLSLDDETDTIFIKSVDGERFIVTVSPVTADETLKIGRASCRERVYVSV